MTSVIDATDRELTRLASETSAELRRRGYVLGWHKPVEYAGAVYVLVNPASPNLVKIGYADDVERRLRSLNSNSGLPDPYHCYAAYEVKKRLGDLKLHKLIDALDPDLRHTGNREFYEMTPAKAYGILSAIAQINGDEDRLSLNPLNDPDITVEASEPVATSLQAESKNMRKSRLNFEMLGIEVGSKLSFVDDPSITVETIDGKSSVRLADGTVCKLSKAALILKEARGEANSSGSYQRGKLFACQGEVLTDMRKRIESGEAV